MGWLTEMLTKYPELGVYLALGIGYWIGGFRFGNFSLGGATGSLIAGMFVGWLFEIPVSATAKSLVFLLFLFGIGYEVGPKFFAAMKGDGWRFGVLAVFMPVVGLLVAWGVAVYLQLDPGLAAGLVSGALTESPAMGTAIEAIHALPLDEATRKTLEAHVGVADALCYVFGALGVILVCTEIGPRLLRIDLKKEALALEALYGIKRQRDGIVSAWKQFEVRAYRVAAGSAVVGRSVSDAEHVNPAARLFLVRLRRDGEILPVTPAEILRAGDIVAVSGRRETLIELLGDHAEEVEDRELLDIPVASYEIFVSNPRWVSRTLAEVSTSDLVRAVYLRRLLRGGQEIPMGTQTRIERGDVLQMVGSEKAVARAAEELGDVIQPTDITDFVTVGLMVVIGALAGAAAAFSIGGVQVSIGTSVGVLLSGIVTGYIRSVRPLFGRVPDGAVKFMQSFGLAGFVAMVGIGAGPHFVVAVRESGVGLLLGGILVTMAPLLAGLWFGRYVLKINPLLLLGAMSGAQTFTAALAALQEKSDSTVAVIGYSGAVPVAHVVLTTWGTVIVLLMT
ncbi:TrkA C-terminal domain-containing protein [Arenimonas daejeonensis]|uniref:aspartate-alanine antiporter-like transporter n=1 Tax=Arenimonas daejeonensis TaxID=370777 RepID=UPI0011BE6957|nr:TrkA C-terminal domain-containing protein [Arenimonas daejeonensis]